VEDNPFTFPRERAEEIANAESFICHKTAYGEESKKRQCAGHMIMTKGQNLYWRFLNAFQDVLPSSDVPIFTKEEFINR